MSPFGNKKSHQCCTWRLIRKSTAASNPCAGITRIRYRRSVAIWPPSQPGSPKLPPERCTLCCRQSLTSVLGGVNEIPFGLNLFGNEPIPYVLDPTSSVFNHLDQLSSRILRVGCGAHGGRDTNRIGTGFNHWSRVLSINTAYGH